MFGSASNRPLLLFRWVSYAVMISSALIAPFLVHGRAEGIPQGVLVTVAYIVFLILFTMTPLAERNSRLTFNRLGLVVGETALAVMLVALFGGAESPYTALFPLVTVIISMEHGPKTGVLSAVSFLIYSLVSAGELTVPLLVDGLLVAVAPGLGLALQRALEAQREAGDFQDLDKLDKAYHLARRETTKRQQHEEELYKERRRFESLVDVALGLAQLREQDQLLDAVARVATDQLNARGGAAFVLEDGVLRCRGQEGLNDPMVEALERCVDRDFLSALSTLSGPLCFDALEGEQSDLEHRLLERFTRLIDPQAQRLPAEIRIDQMVVAPLASAQDGRAFGMLIVLNQNLDKPFTEQEAKYLQVLSSNAAIALKNILFTVELERSHWELIQALAQAIEAKDSYTSNHVGRVRDLSVEMARAIGLDRGTVKVIAIAATLHDVGKISTPDRVLLKPGPLDDEEYEIMKKHAENGALILRGISSLPEGVEEMVRHHHEHYDGKGYPDGKAGKEIPLGAQIISIADCFDAMTYDRPYRKGFPKEEALKRMERGCGTQFNPKLLCVFFALQGYVPETEPVAVSTYKSIVGKLHVGGRFGGGELGAGKPSSGTGSSADRTEQSAKPLLLERN